MTLHELIEDGQLVTALQHQATAVAVSPEKDAERLTLVEVLLFAGDLTGAVRELDAIRDQRAEMVEFLRGYRLIIEAEEKRRKLVSGVPPRFLMPPPPHALLQLEAAKWSASGQAERTQESRDRAEEAAPWVSGHIDGREFEWVRDVDDLTAFALEVFVESDYVWVPFEQIRKLRLSEPESLRDRLYVPAELYLHDGSEWEVCLPAVYAESWKHKEDIFRLGLETDFEELADGSTRGIGAHLLQFGDEELTLADFTQWESASR